MNRNLKLSKENSKQNGLYFSSTKNTPTNIKNDSQLSHVFDFNQSLFLQNSWLEKYLHLQSLSSTSDKSGLQNLLNMDQGGFDHGDLSGLYTSFQNSSRYNSTRLCGWNNLLEIAFNCIKEGEDLENGLILDFLAGSGTLSKKVKQLLPNKAPNIIGLDVSKKMAERARKYEEIVFWGSHEAHPFKSDIADVTIAAYGFHHVPVEERHNFVFSMYQSLKKGGTCIIHDFEEHSSTAKWYSEIIHFYRSVGHPYSHVTSASLQNLLGHHFENIATKYLYDPFYLEGKEGQDVQSLKQEFYAYLICLFNLEKLLPDNVEMTNLAECPDLSYWESIDKIFSPYFKLEKDVIKMIESKPISQVVDGIELKVTIPVVDQLTINPLSDNKVCLIAPRIALVGIGHKEK